MNFWDSSALVPLFLKELTSKRISIFLSKEPNIAVWWSTPVEITSAFARTHREVGGSFLEKFTRAAPYLQKLRGSWLEVHPSEEVRETALRLLRVHKLRAADALQLAAALVYHDQRPSGKKFVCLDERLSEAASKEGFSIVDFRE